MWLLSVVSLKFNYNLISAKHSILALFHTSFLLSEQAATCKCLVYSPLISWFVCEVFQFLVISIINEIWMEYGIIHWTLDYGIGFHFMISIVSVKNVLILGKHFIYIYNSLCVVQNIYRTTCRPVGWGTTLCIYTRFNSDFVWGTISQLTITTIHTNHIHILTQSFFIFIRNDFSNNTAFGSFSVWLWIWSVE